MGYRPWYFMLRTLHRMRSQPSSVGMLVGYARSAARRREQLDDDAARAVLREDQSLRSLRLRREEALGGPRTLDEKEQTTHA